MTYVSITAKSPRSITCLISITTGPNGEGSRFRAPAFGPSAAVLGPQGKRKTGTLPFITFGAGKQRRAMDPRPGGRRATEPVPGIRARNACAGGAANGRGRGGGQGIRRGTGKPRHETGNAEAGNGRWKWATGNWSRDSARAHGDGPTYEPVGEQSRGARLPAPDARQ